MIRQTLIDDLLRIFPWILNGFAFSAWGALMLWIGYSRGWRRGVKDRPDVQKNALAWENHRRVVAEERLETERKVSKRFEVALLQLAETRTERRNG